MATLKQGRADYLSRQGFLPSEAREFSRLSRAGRQAPYVQAMIRSRRSLKTKANQLGWTDKQYRDYIKQQYVNKGYLKSDKLGRKRISPYDLLREFEDKFRRDKSKFWDSEEAARQARRPSVKKGGQGVTRRDMLKSWLMQVNRNLEREKRDWKIADLEKQRDNLQDQLDKLESEGAR